MECSSGPFLLSQAQQFHPSYRHTRQEESALESHFRIYKSLQNINYKKEINMLKKIIITIILITIITTGIYFMHTFNPMDFAKTMHENM